MAERSANCGSARPTLIAITWSAFTGKQAPSFFGRGVRRIYRKPCQFGDRIERGRARLFRRRHPERRRRTAPFRIYARSRGRGCVQHRATLAESGVGTVSLERTLLSARNRGIKSLQMHCLADNKRMQQLASKFEADLKFDFGGVVGEVDPPRYTPMSIFREAVVDAHGVANAILDVQSRIFRPA